MSVPKLDRAPFIAHCMLRDTTPTAVAEVAGVTMNHGRAKDGLSWAMADKLAVALGMHPYEIWGDEWDAIEHVYEAKRAARLERRAAWMRQRRAR